MTALLGTLSAVLVGTADFIGGMTSRRYSGIRVAAIAAATGMPLALLVSVGADAPRVTGADLGWSALAGASVACGLACFYVAMGRGLISIVAPVAAVTGAVIPVAYDLARGHRPGVVALVGLAAGLAAVAIVSVAPAEQHPETIATADRDVIGLSLAAGLLFGLFYIAFSRVSEDAGLWPVTVQRGVATVVLASLALALTRGPLRVSARLAVSVALIAVLEVAAAVPVLIALQRGPVAVATVTASLYPVASVVLAAVVLRERLSRVQYLGVLCALVSVALVSTG